MIKITTKTITGLSAVLLLLNACSSQREFSYAELPEVVKEIKADGGIYKVGNPYTVMGQSYTPKEDYSYSEVGMASWYGDDFHNKRTANGETYNMRTVTAAHRTLPLPSIVKVTNLENGRTIIARVNDRGPYVKNRIIDLSQKGAELLGYRNKGTTKVKVEILKEESIALKEAMLSNTNTSKTYQTAMKNKTATTVAGVQTASTTAKAATTSTVTASNIASDTAANGHYFVQVGAFSDYNKAKEMAESMKRFGTVSIKEAYLSKSGIYRVRLGSYQTRSEALQILDRLLDYGHADVTIVEG
jgi:rare lipoprotein A